MRAFCKCGKCEAWVSGMPLHACDVCDECGTPLAYPGMVHPEPIPHDWKVKYNENTGKPAHERCSRCMAKRPIPCRES